MGLYEKPPEKLNIAGKNYPVNTDFRFWIRFQDSLSGNKSQKERAEALYMLVTELGLPPSSATMDAMLKFYIGESHEKATGGGKNVVAFDLVKDSEYIFSAFKGAYGIDLTEEKMHWWKFKALFKALPDDCQMCKIMMYRTVDLKDVPKSQKAFYRRMKERYALNVKAADTHRSAEEMKAYVQKLAKEAKERGK